MARLSTSRGVTALSPEQEKRIAAAIARARLPGRALYIDGGEPACVIGQLAELEGVSAERMERWKGGVRNLGKAALELQAYPPRLLDLLQLAWDDPNRRPEENRRTSMHRHVEKWQGGHRMMGSS